MISVSCREAFSPVRVSLRAQEGGLTVPGGGLEVLLTP